jgi:hypothetical protein
MSHAADAATGQSIKPDEEIVALVVDRRTGGYPDAATHAAVPGIKPTSLFESLSLPVQGTYDGFGLVKPRRGDLGAELMLDLAGQPDWQSFHDKAFGVRGGIVVNGNEDREPRVLGLAIYRKATWDLLADLSGEKDRKGDVAKVLALMDLVRTQNASGNVNLAFRNANLLLLNQSAFAHDDGRREDLPRLGRALAHVGEGSLMGHDAVERLTRDGGPLGYDLMDRKADDRVAGILGALWNLQAVDEGLYLLGKPYLPSALVGGFDNAGQVFDLGLTMLEDAGNAVVLRHEEWPEGEGLARLEEMLDRADQIRAALLSGIADIKNRGFGP